MTRFISNLLLLTTQYVVLESTTRTLRSVYQPFGPKMCKQLCQDFTDTFYFVMEDLSCLINSTNDSTDNNSSIPLDGKKRSQDVYKSPKTSDDVRRHRKLRAHRARAQGSAMHKSPVTEESVQEDVVTPEVPKRRLSLEDNLPDTPRTCRKEGCQEGLCGLTLSLNCVGIKDSNYDNVIYQQFQFSTHKTTWKKAREKCVKKRQFLLNIDGSEHLVFYADVFHVLGLDSGDYSFHVRQKCKVLKRGNRSWKVVKQSCKKRSFYICVTKRTYP